MKKNPDAKKRKLIGVVTSDAMNKTRIVTVEGFKKHPLYLKYFKVRSKFKAHDENNEYATGDKVVIEETRPLSRDKRWRITGLAQERETQAKRE